MCNNLTLNAKEMEVGNKKVKETKKEKIKVKGKEKVNENEEEDGDPLDLTLAGNSGW